MQFPPYQPPVDNGLDIVYQDDVLLIVNKPAGLLTTPGRGEDKQDCLLSRVQTEFPSAEAVHRLDMATSGLVVIALTKAIHREISILFQQRAVKKDYIAVVQGIMDSKEGHIDLPMITDWPNRPLQVIDHDKGKAALTFYSVLGTNYDLNCSRIALTPQTGRTHQLRLHMKAIGHPVKGDNLYATNPDTAPSSRLLLHATSLEFVHPQTSEMIKVTSYPEF